MPPADEIERAMDTARHAVLAASAACLRHWRTQVLVDMKADRTPVTAADREAESAIIDVIRQAFPSHAILAEESGELPGEGGRWIVDPLDGTRGFARGGSFWGPLVAFEQEGDIVAGAAALPALGETYFAGRGLGAWRDGTRLAVSTVAEWSQATLSLGELKALLAGSCAAGVKALNAAAASTRSYGDPAACLRLAGRRDHVLLARDHERGHADLAQGGSRVGARGQAGQGVGDPARRLGKDDLPHPRRDLRPLVVRRLAEQAGQEGVGYGGGAF